MAMAAGARGARMAGGTSAGGSPVPSTGPDSVQHERLAVAAQGSAVAAAVAAAAGSAAGSEQRPAHSMAEAGCSRGGGWASPSHTGPLAHITTLLAEAMQPAGASHSARLHGVQLPSVAPQPLSANAGGGHFKDRSSAGAEISFSNGLWGAQAQCGRGSEREEEGQASRATPRMAVPPPAAGAGPLPTHLWLMGLASGEVDGDLMAPLAPPATSTQSASLQGSSVVN